MWDSTRRDVFLGAAGMLATTGQTASTGQGGAAAPVRPAPLSVRDFGATGDGLYRPLRDRYPTLAAARRRFPFAADLDQSVDHAAIQAALNAAAEVAGTVYLPAGRYIVSDTLLIPSYVSIEGEARSGAIIDNQNLRLDKPQFANKEPSSFVHVTMRNLTGHGGTHFLKVDAAASCSYNCFEAINTNLQSVSDFQFNRLEVSRFDNCNLLSRGSGYRIDVQNYPCNANMLTNVRMTASGRGAINLTGGELWLMLGGSIESGGSPGRADITLGAVPHLRGARFLGVYFESGNELALRAASAATGIVFEGCHFTGASSSQGFAPPRFEAGSSIVEFAGNDFAPLRGKGARGSAQMLLRGHNDGLTTAGAVIWDRLSADGGVVRGRERRLGAAPVPLDLLRFAPVTVGAAERPVLRGVLRLRVTDLTGSAAPYSATIEVIVELGPDRKPVLRHLPTADAGPARFRVEQVVAGQATALRLVVVAAPRKWVLLPSFEFDVIADLPGGGTIAVTAA